MALPPCFLLLLILLPGPAVGLQGLGEGAEMAAGLPGLGLLELPELEPPELEPECRRLLGAFAEGSAALSRCLARRARPVRLCQACRGHYSTLLGLYRDIALGVRRGMGSGWGSGCRGAAARRPCGVWGCVAGGWLGACGVWVRFGCCRGVGRWAVGG